MLVEDIMNTGLKTVRANDLVREAASTMCFQKISGLPVIDDEDNLIGIISEKDILYRMFPNPQDFLAEGTVPDFEELERSYRHVMDLHVTDLMTRSVASVDEKMPVLKAASMMWVRKIRRIPVSRDGKLIGIVSIGDVHKAIFKANLAT